MTARLLATLAWLGFAGTCVAAPLSPESQTVFDTHVKPFLVKHCIKCHGEQKTLAGLRVDTLETDFLSGKAADVWKEMYDRVGNGTMPPEDQPRPEAAETSVVADWIVAELAGAEKLAKGAAGRIPTRRLNRTEYANTLRDLFYLDDETARTFEELLPADGVVDGFDRGAAGLFIDDAQLAKYLELAERVLERNLFAPEPLRVQHRSVAAKDFRWNGPGEGLSTNLSTYPVGDARARENRIVIPYGADTGEVKPDGIEYVSAGTKRGGDRLALEGRYWNWWPSQLTKAEFTPGWYRLKVRAGAFAGTGKYDVGKVTLSVVYRPNLPIEAQAAVVVDAPLDAPRDYETRIYLRPGDAGSSQNFVLRWNGGGVDVVVRHPEIEAANKAWNDVSNGYRTLVRRTTPRRATEEEIAAAKKRLDAQPEIFHRTMEQVTVHNIFNPEVDLAAIPRIKLESIEIEGPLGEWPPRGLTELLFDGAERAIDEAYLREMFARFLPRAYRRPVSPDEVNELAAWVQGEQQKFGLTGDEALRRGLKTVLCSPDFLLLQEPAGDDDQTRPLTDYELANRLSYFLWSTMPDAELFRLASENKLHDPETLLGQVRRMIADPKSDGFVTNFTGQWLKVREFSNVVTDRVQYASYDDALRDASRREPIEFFRVLLAENLSILNFLDSDFAVVDGRLAKHYGIDGVYGDEFQKVSIGRELHRGGVLGMAGVLTYLSDGTRTLPVRRGAYILETMWNTPPRPPPPNVGDLPAVGKVKTVRERLELHRLSDSCASCHTKIDPFGIALENYDAIGAWRERMNGERFNGDASAPPLDVSGVLPSGREFANVEEFKQALLEEKTRFVHGFVEKMLAYALGRPVGATDRPTVLEVTAALERDAANSPHAYGLQTLIEAVVAGRPFQTK